MADEKAPFWEHPDIWPDEYLYMQAVAESMQQHALMDRLAAVAADPVYELKSLFGVNHRTAERWISGNTTMRRPLQLKLAHALVGIAEAQTKLQAMDARERLFFQIASTRVQLDPLPKD
ncbi:hypothetical protein [Aureimonas sp. AU40]|uniref:hypothetical protein n=1 Tax=Aureimonas sp. AU40 TaxID=1637747 RepID=UPI000785BE95|nr:hypothetical protein [Aureimonas sp. AU40]